MESGARFLSEAPNLRNFVLSSAGVNKTRYGRTNRRIEGEAKDREGKKEYTRMLAARSLRSYREGIRRFIDDCDR